VQIPTGGNTLLVRVAIINDTAFDNNETFTLTAANTGGINNVTSTGNEGIVTIKDDGTGSMFAEGNNTSTPDADILASSLNDDRVLGVNDVTVNEGSPYLVFTVTGIANQVVTSLALANSTTGSIASGSGVDYGTSTGTGLEYWNSVDSEWLIYPGGSISLDSTGTLLVRTPITNDDDDDNGETFKLVVKNSNDVDVIGTGTIKDDGTGTVFVTDDPTTPDVDESAPVNGVVPTVTAPTTPVVLAADAGSLPNDDRPLTVTNVTVNEGSPYAVLSVGGIEGQYVKLSLTDGTAKADTNGIPLTDGSEDYSPDLEYFNGTDWVDYTPGSFVQIPSDGDGTPGEAATLLVRVAIINDTVADNNETFTLTATNTGGVNNLNTTIAPQGVVTIKDDDSGNIFSGVSASADVSATTLDYDRNDAPAGTNKAVTIAEDGSYTFSADDFGFTDPNDPNQNNFESVTITSLPDPAKGTLTLDGQAVDAGDIIAVADIGKLVYTPADNSNGSPQASFTFQVTDDGGTDNNGQNTDQSPNTFTINVTPVDDLFTDESEQESGPEDTVVTGNVIDAGLTSGDGLIRVSGFIVEGILDSNNQIPTFTAGQTVSISGVGTIKIESNGDYTFTPVANYSGTVPTVTYSLTDGYGLEEVSELNIEITPVDDPFIDGNEVVSTPLGTPISGNLVDGVSVDGPISITTFTINGVTGTFNAGLTPVTISGIGEIVIKTNGEYNFTPANNYFGTVPQITYVLTDGLGPNDTSTLDITVIDATKVAVTTTNITEDDTSVTFNFALSVAPEAGYPATLTVMVAGTSYTVPVDEDGEGILTVSGLNNSDVYVDSGSITATVTAIIGGNYSVTSVSGATATAQITDTINPTTVSLTATATVDEGVTNGITYTATLSNNVVANNNITVTLANGETITILAGQTSGSVSIHSPSEDIYIDTSTLANSIAAVVEQGTTGKLESLAAVANTNVTTSITDTINPTTVSLSTADVTEGSASVTFTATLSAVGQTDVIITTSQGDITILAGNLTGTLVKAITNIEDVYLDASTLAATITSATGGNFEQLTIATATATAQIADTINPTTVTLSSATNGTAITEGGSIVYTATVASAVSGSPLVVTLSNGAVITIPVGETTANSSPVVVRADEAYIQGTDTLAAVTISTATQTANTVGNFEALTTSGTVANTVVDDADPTTVTLSSATNGTAITEGGSIVYTATVASAVSGSPLVVTLSNGAVITIPVGETTANSSPVVVRIADSVSQGIQNLDPVTISSATQTANTVGKFEAITTAGTVNNTVVDGDVIADTDEAVSTPEDTPISGNVIDAGLTSNDGPIALKSFTVDTDNDGSVESFNAGQTATIAGVGTITIASNGNYTFTPLANWTGTVPPVTYSLTDDAGATVGDTSTLIITVDAVNDIPVDPNDTNTVIEDTTLTVPANAGLLVGATDTEGNALTITSYLIDGISGTQAVGSAVTIPNVGSLTINADGSYSFTPVLNYTGAIPLVTYTLSDGNGGTDTSTLTLTMVPVNDVPVDPDDTNTVTEDTTLTVPANAGLLVGATDVENNTLTITGYTVPGLNGTQVVGSAVTIRNVGSLTINADGSYSFTPVLNYTGAIPVVTYTLSDGNGGTDTSTLTLTMVPVNDAPVDPDDTNTVTEDTTLTVPANAGLLVDATDVEGNALTITGYTIDGISGAQVVGSAVTIPNVGLLTINADGSYSFVPVANYTGAIPVVTYTLSDGNGGTDTSTLTLTMVPVNDAPVDQDDTNTVTEDITLTVLANAGLLVGATDPDGDTLTITGYTVPGLTGTQAVGSAVTIPNVGLLTINADGSYSFVPVANYTGAIPVVTYTLSDGNGGTDTSTLTLTMVPVDDPWIDQSEKEPVGKNTLLLMPADKGLLQNIANPDGVAGLRIDKFSIAGVSGEHPVDESVEIEGVGTLTINRDGGYSFMPAVDYTGTIPVVTYTISDIMGRTVTSTLTLTMPQNPPLVRGTPTFYKPYEHPLIEVDKFKFKPVILDFNGAYGGINQFSLPHGETTVHRDQIEHTEHTPYFGFDRFNADVLKAHSALEQQASFEKNDSELSENIAPVPEVKVDSKGKANYQLPKEVFLGAKGKVKLVAFDKDGQPLPHWIKFNPETGEFEIAMPDDINEPVEVQVIATDIRGEKTQAKVLIKPLIDKSTKTAFIGKSSLTSQIKSAMMLGGGRN
jgi:CshA-type fibril repeat protein